jgi:cell division septal protein FtsQ
MAERALRLPHTSKLTRRAVVPRARTLAWPAGLVVAAALIYVIARESSMFAVTSVEVSGAPPAVAAQARAALRAVEGRSLLRLAGPDVVSTLERLPWVYRASYDRDFPHTLRIRIVPERPVAVLRRGAGSWLVSARGRVIASLRRGALPSLPRIWLGRTAVIRVGAIVNDASGALASRALRSFRGAGLGARIAFVKASAGRIVAGLRGGLELRLGLPIDIGVKLAVARAVLPTLALPAAGGPRYLDLAVPERPVAGTDPQVEG